MAAFDSRLAQIVVRIVYDGPGTAGKTTNLVSLQDLFTRSRRGEMFTPETTQGRTLYFDQMPLEGGLIAGHRFRCELWTVPGQDVLRHRRDFLLARSDVVVFVVDSRREGLQEAARVLSTLRAPDGGYRRPLVVQANKQDMPDALPLEEVRRALELDEKTPVIAAVAHEGKGVRDTALWAMRLAAMELQPRVIEYGPEVLSTEVELPEEVHRQMRMLPLAVPAASNYSSEPPAGDEAQEVVTGSYPPAEPHESIPPSAEALASSAAGPVLQQAAPATDSPASSEEKLISSLHAAPVEVRPSTMPTVVPTDSIEVHPRVRDQGLDGGPKSPAPGQGDARHAQPIEGAGTDSPDDSTNELSRARPSEPPTEAEPSPAFSVAPGAGLVTGETKSEAPESDEPVEESGRRRTPLPAPPPPCGVPSTRALSEGQGRIGEHHDAHVAQRADAPVNTAAPSTVRPAASISSSGSSSGRRFSRIPEGFPVPTLPSSNVRSFNIWPPASGRESLKLVPFERAEYRPELRQRKGKEDGSAKPDTFVYRAGTWCLKTSAQRCYPDEESARAALVQLARRKVALGEHLPPHTVLVVQDSPEGFWLWTVSPWLRSLRFEMTEAEAIHSHAALSMSLCYFAQASVSALSVLRERHVAMDVHPSNFARVGQQLVYLDDDIAIADHIPTIGHAWLRRVEEYRSAMDAVERYVAALEEQIQGRLTQKDVVALGLEAAVSETLVQSDLAHEAAERLVLALRQCQ